MTDAPRSDPDRVFAAVADALLLGADDLVATALRLLAVGETCRVRGPHADVVVELR